ncbi:MAG: ankyrin repeat domain-containing protein [Burkholderiaceae bacterium]
MRILEYTGLDVSSVAKSYRKVVAAIAAGDFRTAQVKKLSNLSHGKFYRARLDDANRLLFSLVRHGDEVCVLMLEVIANHAYDKSRFLRGATIDETKIPDAESIDVLSDAEPLRYLHPGRASIHWLDKPISFDEAQSLIYGLPAPLVIIGSAGSGKSALVLEKLKNIQGEVLYVTHSAYLAQTAQALYYANGFEPAEQEAVFLSYREFIESIRVPSGREATWRDFSGWFGRMRQTYRGLDAHQVFEEIRGVIAAGADGALTRSAYQALGIRQSIFSEQMRDPVYDLFEKYSAWLVEAKLFDINLVAHDWMKIAAARYDFVVIDEVQDMTPVQLALALKTLKKPGMFLLCGDSNQIVHPNFFSWAQVKSLFWNDPQLAQGQKLQTLTANFRNGQEATRVANQLLKIKQRRFGSIDRESNYLVQAVGGEPGAVSLMADKSAIKESLDRQTRKSTEFAVLVMRDEDKAEARKHFSTPLLFSIHEAKGLEYQNIIIYRFVSDHRAEFNEIVSGVDKAALVEDGIEYGRAKDKRDKSLEIYKFFVNALYVALTRAIRNIYLIESDIQHPVFDLLGVANAEQLQVTTKESTTEDWQREARKLELQGKLEQADAIRRNILQQTPVPWPVFDQAQTEALLLKVFRERAPGSKHRQQLYDIAACHDLSELARHLVQQAKFEPAKGFSAQRTTLGRKTYTPYLTNKFKDILQLCNRHGLEHRLPMNMTPLMAAAAGGNIALVEMLIERGADRTATDHFGNNALHWAMREAFNEPKFAQGPFKALYDLLAPLSLDFNTGDRLVRIDRHLSEYFLLQTFWVLFRTCFTHRQSRPYGAIDTRMVLDAWRAMPEHIVTPQRNKRSHLSNVLARNEVSRDYAYNRALFWRVRQGWYQMNPALAVRKKTGELDTWVPVYDALNLPFAKQFASQSVWGQIDSYLVAADMPVGATPLMGELDLTW